jgi:hypothetical protein
LDINLNIDNKNQDCKIGTVFVGEVGSTKRGNGEGRGLR